LDAIALASDIAGVEALAAHAAAAQAAVAARAARAAREFDSAAAVVDAGARRPRVEVSAAQIAAAVSRAEASFAALTVQFERAYAAHASMKLAAHKDALRASLDTGLTAAIGAITAGRGDGSAELAAAEEALKLFARAAAVSAATRSASDGVEYVVASAISLQR
jgi:hypothetical protein